MNIYIKVNNTEYPAAVNGVYNDRTWDGRDTKTVTLTMTHAEVAAKLRPMIELRERVVAYNTEVKAALQLTMGSRRSCCAIPPSAQCLSGTGVKIEE